MPRLATNNQMFAPHPYTWEGPGYTNSYLSNKVASVHELLKEHPITLIPELTRYNKEQITNITGGPTVVCDFAVDEVDETVPFTEQWRNRFVMIDHHSDMPKMERHISSTNIAINFVRQFGPMPKDWHCIIHHTDADSLLSSSIIRGILPPDEMYGEAAIAADHTGEANEIADLLQAIAELRDIEYSLEQLCHLLNHEPLSQAAELAYQEKLQERDEIYDMVERGAFNRVGDVSYAVLPKKIESVLIPLKMLNSVLVLLFSPVKDNPKNWEVKFRIGAGAPEGLSLRKLGLGELTKADGGFGGRWNAGSNKRGGGSTKEPYDYALLVSNHLKSMGISCKPQ